MEYTFHYGDFVETVDGKIGYLTYVDGKTEASYSTDNDDFVSFAVYTLFKDETGYHNSSVKEIPKYFKRIGKYDFTTWAKKISQPIPKIERLENQSLIFENYLIEKMYDKINQLVDTVNKMNER